MPAVLGGYHMLSMQCVCRAWDVSMQGQELAAVLALRFGWEQRCTAEVAVVMSVQQHAQ
jgi:hypothetical protein